MNVEQIWNANTKLWRFHFSPETLKVLQREQRTLKRTVLPLLESKKQMEKILRLKFIAGYEF